MAILGVQPIDLNGLNSCSVVAGEGQPILALEDPLVLRPAGITSRLKLLSQSTVSQSEPGVHAYEGGELATPLGAKGVPRSLWPRDATLNTGGFGALGCLSTCNGDRNGVPSEPAPKSNCLATLSFGPAADARPVV